MLKAINFITNQRITTKTPMVVSVSGGVDSISLLHLLKLYNYNCIVVHFNHHMRKGNDDEAKLVSDYANRYHYPFHLFDINVESGNFQNEARKLRHLHLKEIAVKYKTKYILTAHHLDDLAETIIMRLTRGSNLYGYAGIHPITDSDGFLFLRPLLEYSKQDIIKYANNYHLEYLDDESNYLSHYTRNRVRLNIMPILKQENPKVLDKFYDFHQIISRSFSFIRKYSYSKISDDLTIDINNFLKEETLIQDEIIAILLDNYKIESSFNLINDLKSLLKSKRPNLSYNLNNQYLFIKSYNEAYITLNTPKNSFEIALKKTENILPNMKKLTFLDDNESLSENAIKLCYNKITLPLIARTRKDGDVLEFDFGSKKLKDYFIDKKIPRNIRDEILIITDSKGVILYVDGIYLNNTLGNNNYLSFRIEETKQGELKIWHKNLHQKNGDPIFL